MAMSQLEQPMFFRGPQKVPDPALNLEYYGGEWMSESEANARRAHDYIWPGSKKIGVSE